MVPTETPSPLPYPRFVHYQELASENSSDMGKGAGERISARRTALQIVGTNSMKVRFGLTATVTHMRGAQRQDLQV